MCNKNIPIIFLKRRKQVLNYTIIYLIKSWLTTQLDFKEARGKNWQVHQKGRTRIWFDKISYRVEVFNIKGRVREWLVEVFRIQLYPCIISHHDYSLSIFNQLIDDKETDSTTPSWLPIHHEL
jgi:hypothetical protein